MKPDPVPDWLPNRPPVVDWMVTTAGETLSAAVITAEDSSMRTSDTVVPSVSVVSPAGVATGRNRLVMATALRAPDRMPESTAMVTTGPARRPPRGSATGAAGGRVDHAGGLCHAADAGAGVAGGPYRWNSI